MTIVVVIVLVKLALICLRWPHLCTRVGSWIVSLANVVGHAATRERREDPLPVARVVRR